MSTLKKQEIIEELFDLHCCTQFYFYVIKQSYLQHKLKQRDFYHYHSSISPTFALSFFWPGTSNTLEQSVQFSPIRNLALL